MSKKKRILIIDDNYDLRSLVRLTFEGDEYEFYEAEEAKSGIEMITTVQPDIVLLDVMMPGEMNGYDVCTFMRNDASLSAIKILMISALGQKLDIEKAQGMGVDGYIVKPFSPIMLIDNVERLLADS